MRNAVAPTATITHGDRNLITFASSIGEGTTSKVKKAHALLFAGVDETLSQLATMSVPSMPQRQVEVKLTKTGTCVTYVLLPVITCYYLYYLHCMEL